MPEPMRFHALAPDVRCPACGRAGLIFMRVRSYRDLYRCAATGLCECRVIHYWDKATKTCGYSVIYGSVALGKWNTCCERPAAKGE